jgi:hypothetical protein
MTAIKEKLANNTQQLLALIAEEHLYPREAARQMAFRRLRKLIIPHP